MKKRRYLPAIRGLFGDWTYYSCVMPMGEIARRTSFAEDLRKNDKLSQMIQRELIKKRANEIAGYLKSQPERFFNSLVVAVYKGDPAWHGFGDIRPRENADIDEGDLLEEEQYCIGFLSFNGSERLFAVDGQHRLAGMKLLLDELDEDSSLLCDQVPVIFVAHKDDKKGLERTRRLFTTLNKNAKSVSKGETIALDEDDVMAIVARRLVEEHKYFNGDRISYRATNNLPSGDIKSWTTIGNLYDVLSVLFSKMHPKVSIKDLQFNRPTESELDEYYQKSLDFFVTLAKSFHSLSAFFKSKNPSAIVAKYRGAFGGSILFRPIGLKVIAEVIAELSKSMSVNEAIKSCETLPENLTELPYEGLIWDSHRSNMASPLKAALTRDLLLYMLDAKSDSTSIRNRYATGMGMPGQGKVLMSRLKKL
jgi:DNA sulfur modification protein DndB